MGVLRLLLALVVVGGHSGSFGGWRLTGNFVAVQTFFIISGFYMALILNEKYRGPGSYRLFITNRFLRLFPAYWVVLGLTLVLASSSYLIFGTDNIISHYINNPNNLAPSTLCYLTLTNLAIGGQDIIYFLSVDSQGLLQFSENFRNSAPLLWTYLFVPQAWSIALELVFYLLAPFILRRRSSWLLGALLISAALRISLHKGLGLNFDPWTYRFFPNELGLFVLGGLSYRLYEGLRSWSPPHGLSMLIISSYVAMTVCYQWLPGGIALKGCYYGLTTLSLPFLFLLTKRLHWDRRVGELSYPVYISHFLFLPSFDGHYWLWPTSPTLESLQHSSAYGWIVSFCTLLISWALLRWVIDPIEGLRQQRVLHKIR